METSRFLGRLEGVPVHLKCENLQRTGSYKLRGAYNRMSALSPDERARGVVAASAGNHAQGVAYAARELGIHATIFMPVGVALPKLEATRAYGADVVLRGDSIGETLEAAAAFAAESGATIIPPFDHPDVVAGQGTLGLEILEDLPDIDAIIVAIGGGGLISGVATALRALRPSVRIVGVEPTGSPTLKASIDAGHVVTLDRITTRVATMSCRKTDERVFETVRGTVDDIVLVTDEEMAEAARWLWFEMGIAADLSGAASLAALRRAPASLVGARHVCALVCGAGAEGTAAGPA
jgi:threonine dehydratase